jgi:hypothetical protein
MENIPIKSKNPGGIHQKYHLSKVDGTPLDSNSEYFVLRLDKGGDPAHVRASKAAIRKYAAEIANDLPELSSDILSKYSD